MSFPVKRRIVIAALIVLTVWPLIHHGLVRIADLSPWKAFGWSMYCVPHRVISLEVMDLDRERALPIASTAEQQRPLRRSLKRYTDLRSAVGRWVEPDDIAPAIFDAFPNVNRIAITVHTGGLDRRSARFVMLSSSRYSYRRPGTAAATTAD